MASLTNKHLALIALAILAIPSASAANPVGEPIPDTIGRVLDGERVTISFSSHQGIDSGDILPICKSNFQAIPNQATLGTIQDGCFKPDSTGPTMGDKGVVCGPLILTILPEDGPPIAAKPNQTCVASLQHLIQDLLSGELPPLRLGIQIRL